LTCWIEGVSGVMQDTDTILTCAVTFNYLHFFINYYRCLCFSVVCVSL